MPKKAMIPKIQHSMNFLRDVMKRERERKRVSQEWVAKQIGISRAYFAQLEGGSRHVYWDLWIAWCSALRVSPSYVIDRWQKQGGFFGIDQNRMIEHHQTLDEMVKYGLHLELDNLMLYFKSLINIEKESQKRENDRIKYREMFDQAKEQGAEQE